MTATKRPLITPRLLLPDRTIQTFREAPILLHVPSVQPLICEDVERYDQQLLINNNLEIHIHGCHGHFSSSGKRANMATFYRFWTRWRRYRIAVGRVLMFPRLAPLRSTKPSLFVLLGER